MTTRQQAVVEGIAVAMREYGNDMVIDEAVAVARNVREGGIGSNKRG